MSGFRMATTNHYHVLQFKKPSNNCRKILTLNQNQAELPDKDIR
jgi:hypothetical protein